MNVSISTTPAPKPSTSAADEIKIITLCFRSEEYDGSYEIADKELLYVFTLPNYLGEKYSLIKWNSRPCGIKLTADAQDWIANYSEELKNPWCAEVNARDGKIKCPARMLSEFRAKLTGVFALSDSWINLDGSEFNGEVIREKAVY